MILIHPSHVHIHSAEMTCAHVMLLVCLHGSHVNLLFNLQQFDGPAFLPLFVAATPARVQTVDWKRPGRPLGRLPRPNAVHKLLVMRPTGTEILSSHYSSVRR